MTAGSTPPGWRASPASRTSSTSPSPYKQVSREWKAENTVVRLPGGVTVGGPEVVTIAGPCSVENERQIIDAARLVKERGP